MAYFIDITESEVMMALRSWLLSVFSPEPPQVVQGLDNRVPMPLNPMIVMTTISKVRLATNEHRYVDVSEAEQTRAETLMRTEQSIQLDIYGAESADYAELIAILWRDPYACEFLLSSGIQPLYCDDPKLMPITNGEAQWEKRWTLTVLLQYNPTATRTPQEFADAANVTLVNVEATFPT